MTTNKPEVVGYVPIKNGKLVGEELSLEDFTEQLRENPAGLSVEPLILLRDYKELQAKVETLIKMLEQGMADAEEQELNSWIDRERPHGDADAVGYAWEASGECQDIIAAHAWVREAIKTYWGHSDDNQ